MTRNNDEVVTYRRRLDLVGFELREVEAAPPFFINYASGFELLASTGFRGQLWHRGSELAVEPGRVLCARPGEVISVQRVS
jgi:hypothetical protein